MTGSNEADPQPMPGGNGDDDAISVGGGKSPLASFGHGPFAGQDGRVEVRW